MPLVFILKLVFLITRYGITASSISCEQSDSNLTTAVITKVDHEYILTVIMYVIVNVLRIVEYLLLGKQFHSFFFQRTEIDPCTFFTKHSKRFCYLLLFFIVLLPYFFLGFAIPALGIHQEIEHTERLEKCYRHYHEIFITYCAVNFLRYASAFAVRIRMIYTALFIDKLWFPDDVSMYTSVGLDKLTKSMSLKSGQGCTLISDQNSGENVYETWSSESAETGASPHSKKDETNEDNTDHEQLFNDEFLQDWKEVSTDFKEFLRNIIKLAKKYKFIRSYFKLGSLSLG